MTKEIPIRTVTIELLRAGPPHNQLLSPLTQYLGICGDSQAGIVNLPYEHRAFLRLLKSMRYDSGEDADRLPVLHDMGVEMAKILGAIPRLPGALTSDPDGPDILVHLRLVLSASELAALPFELAKIPVGPAAWAEGWLALQTRPPVVITRRTRNVSPEGVRWPTRPRVLFIASDPADIPFEEHRAELLAALQPFRYPGRSDPVLTNDGRREQFGDLLTILKDARFDDVVTECASIRYTHVHVLAHGDVDPAAEDRSYGLVLHTADGEADVISGERFAQRVRLRGRRCDSPAHRGNARELRQRQCRVGDHPRRQLRACAASGRHSPGGRFPVSTRQARFHPGRAQPLSGADVGREPVAVAAPDPHRIARAPHNPFP